jgi:hypothetical protein
LIQLVVSINVARKRARKVSQREFLFYYLFSFIVIRASSTVSKTISLFDISPRMRDIKMPNAKPAAKPIDATATILLLIV